MFIMNGLGVGAIDGASREFFRDRESKNKIRSRSNKLPTIEKTTAIAMLAVEAPLDGDCCVLEASNDPREVDTGGSYDSETAPEATAVLSSLTKVACEGAPGVNVSRR